MRYVLPSWHDNQQTSEDDYPEVYSLLRDRPVETPSLIPPSLMSTKVTSESRPWTRVEKCILQSSPTELRKIGVLLRTKSGDKSFGTCRRVLHTKTSLGRGDTEVVEGGIGPHSLNDEVDTKRGGLQDPESPLRKTPNGWLWRSIY